jgi:DnaJ-class molecular chaperone
MKFDEHMLENYKKNKKLSENDGFMLCPRCNGTELVSREICSYCNGSGVITWIDRFFSRKRIPN